MKFLHDSLLLAAKDLKIYFRDPIGLLLGFLVPIALVTVFGVLMTYAFGGSSGGIKVTLYVVDSDDSEASERLVKSLVSGGMLSVKSFNDQVEDPEANLRTKIREGDAHHGLVIPPGYGEAIESGALPNLRMLRDPGRGMEDQIIQIAILRGLMGSADQQMALSAFRRLFANQGLNESQLDQLNERFVQTGQLLQSFDVASTDQDQAASAEAPPSDTPADTPADKPAASSDDQVAASETQPINDVDPMAILGQLLPMTSEDISPPDRSQQVTFQQAQSVSGMTVMMLLFGMVGSGTLLLHEKESGTLRRLFGLPIARESALMGKWLSTATLGVIQILVLFIYGELVFGVGLFQSPLTMMVLVISWVAVATSFAMLLATACKSSKQAEGLSSITILVMAALGGCWFPTQLMSLPPWMEWVTRGVPTFWAMTGFQGMLWNNLDWLNPKMLQAVGIQWVFVAVMGSLSVYFFRRNYCSAESS